MRFPSSPCAFLLIPLTGINFSLTVAAPSSSPSTPATQTIAVKFDQSTASSQAAPFTDTLFSISFEFCYLADYLGSPGAPNTLSLALLQNIEDRTGSAPNLRLGGDTQDVAFFCDNCTAFFNATYVPNNTEAVSVAYNAQFFDVLNHNVPRSAKYVFGVNFKGNDLALAAAEVSAAQLYLDQEKLLYYELGNEVDIYDMYGRNFRPGGWNVDLYVAQAEQWLNYINQREKAAGKSVKAWQIGTFAQPPVVQGNFSLREVIALGTLQEVGNVRSLSDHTYFSSVCSLLPSRPTYTYVPPLQAEQAALVSLPYLMSHNNIVSYFAQWSPEILATHAAKLPFVMGETGSVSCHGRAGISNTLGAALWSIDYVLHGAVLEMDGVYFHQGTAFAYSMWQPVEYGGQDAVVWNTYYGMIFTAEVIGHLTNARVYQLSSLSTDTLVLYAIYAGSSLRKIVAVNFELYNYPPAANNTASTASSSSSARPGITLDLSSLLPGGAAEADARLRVKRLTGPGSGSQTGATLMGQSFATGKSSGHRVLETVEGGLVFVGASEAVIVEVQ